MKIMNQKDLLNIIAARLKSARQEANLTQSEIAEMLGLQQTSFSQIETGRVLLRVDHLAKLAKILNKPADYFLGYPAVTDDKDIANIISIARQVKPEHRGLMVNVLKAFLQMSDSMSDGGQESES